MSQSRGQDELDLERRVLAGGAFYLDRIERDLDHSRLSFALVADPESSTVVRTLTFTDIRDFEELWDEEEDLDLMEQIIGLHQYGQADGSRYLIRLYQSEMHFFSKTEPQVIESKS